MHGIIQKTDVNPVELNEHEARELVDVLQKLIDKEKGSTMTVTNMRASREVRIDSYFSLPTDLAAEMSAWPEFVDGVGYCASLRSEAEEVSVTLEYDEQQPIVVVRGAGEGQLFYRVLGATLYAMAKHSDDLWTRVMNLAAG